MAHSKQKYAFLDWTYVFEVDRTLEMNVYNISPDGQHQGSSIVTETPNETSIFHQTYWARRSNNKRGHSHLSEWYNNIAYGIAVQQIEAQIDGRNATNAAKLQAWEQSWSGQQVAAGLPSVNAKPERIIYRPYDATKFTCVRLYGSDVAGDPNEEIEKL